MRLAIHFEQDATSGRRSPFFTIARKLFPIILQLPKPKITSQVFIGSLLLHSHAYKRGKERSDGWTEKFNPQLFRKILHLWANPPPSVFCTFTEQTLLSAVRGDLYVICFTSINKLQAMKIHAAFKRSKAYRGAVEVDNSYSPHTVLYSHGLGAFGRIHGSDFSLFWDGLSEDSKDTGVLSEMKKFGFRTVKFESLNGRYSIFDKRFTPEQTLLSGETRKLCEGLLVETVERVLNILTDTAPALPEKLHAALSAFSAAKTDEQVAHVALTCRRIIEYVTDCIFSPQVQPSPSGRKLDKQAYRNRLLAYADVARSSDTSIDLIVVSTTTLAEQLERLEAAVNKGVHAELLDVEARRCIIRTVMLLDDLISLKSTPFEMKPELQSL